MLSDYKGHYFSRDEVRRSVHGGGKLAAFTICLEAWRRGLSVTFLDALPYEFELSDGVTTARFDRGLPAATTREAFRTCNNKSKALRHMGNTGVPVPSGRRVDASTTNFADVAEIARSIGYPVVIKPVLGSMGRGVFSGLRNEEQLEYYYRHVVDTLGKNRLIIEKHFEGEDYRVFVVGETVAAATWRRPAEVVGDGAQTVSELIAEKNHLRRSNPALSKELIVPDLEVDQQLSGQGLTYESVPRSGVHVRLRGKANLSTGGEIVDVTHLLPETVKEAAVQAVAAIPGLVSAGVDVMVNRAPEELDESAESIVIELNARAHLGGHMFPSEGPGHNAAGALVDYFFPHIPQLTEKTAARISFDIDDVLRPMRLGVVQRTTLAPIPDHRYPYRRILTFPSVRTLPRESRDLISRRSRSWDIAGSLRSGENGLELRIAGEETEVDRFVTLIVDTVGSGPVHKGEWSGVVWKGFKVDVRGAG